MAPIVCGNSSDTAANNLCFIYFWRNTIESRRHSEQVDVLAQEIRVPAIGKSSAPSGFTKELFYVVPAIQNYSMVRTVRNDPERTREFRCSAIYHCSPVVKKSEFIYARFN